MMKPYFLRWLPSLAAGVSTALILSGCVTYGDARQRQGVHEREDMLIIQEDLRRLKGQIEGLEMETERLHREVADLRNEQSRAIRNQRQDADGRLTDLERRISEVDRARERDKQEIVDRLSKTIEQIIATSAQPGTARGPRATSGYGYEHTVRPGETLSQIASAYNVRSSAIIEANNIQNPDVLRAGQVLFIPE